MRHSQAMSRLRRWSLATMAAATVSLSPLYAQQVAEPEGMPVYRQKRSGFFQNPFSTTYQKIWNRSKTEAAAPVVSQPTGVSHTNAGHAAFDEAQIVSVDGEPVTSQPLNASARPMARSRSGQIFHTARKPASAPAAVPHTGRVLHVKDVNEGTPAVGSEYEVQPDAALIQSLANGEKIVSVKERVIGVYRNGQLVPVNQTEAAPTTPVPTAPARPVRKEVDPWFGDTVDAPSEDVRGSGEEVQGEVLPPQSEADLPALPGEEILDGVEQTSFTGANGEQVTLMVPAKTPERTVGVQVGDVPAPLPLRTKTTRALPIMVSEAK